MKHVHDWPGKIIKHTGASQPIGHGNSIARCPGIELLADWGVDRWYV